MPYHLELKTDPGAGVSIWCMQADAIGAAQLAAIESLLDEAEQARARRLISPDRRREAICAHALLRVALGVALDMAPKQIRLATTPGKKPRITNAGTCIDVSLSHTSGLVACAVARGCDVGIDVEKITDVDRSEVALPVFAADELAWILHDDRADVASAFYRVWTLKEAVLKATGEGLTDDATSFSVLPDPPRFAATQPRFGATGHWHLWQSERLAGYVLAVAARSFVGEREAGLKRSPR